MKMVPAAPLLASLLPEFRDKEENIMTLALFHVLQQHGILKDNFIAWIFEKVSQKPPERVRARPQVQAECPPEVAENSQRRWIRPDICFLDDQKEGESPVLLMENKFFAGLTDGQPVKYIAMAARDQPAGLVLVAPRSRIRELQEECHRRCKDACLVPTPIENGYFSVDRKFVYFLSWEELLDHLYETAVESVSAECKSDISQLEGIRRRMEGERIGAFLEGELAQLKQIAYRLPQLNRLLVKVKEEIDCLRKFGTKWEKSEIQGGLILDIHGKDFWLLPDFELLARDERSVSPFWLRIGFDSTWKRNRNTSFQTRQRIRLAMEGTGQNIRDFPAETFSIPLPFGTEQNEQDLVKAVVATILQLNRNLDDLLDTSPTGHDSLQ
jgi:hypothetical protein